jgi:hypothetical protein
MSFQQTRLTTVFETALSQTPSPVRRIIEPDKKKMTTTKYVAGFVIPRQKDKIDLYQTMAEAANDHPSESK